MSTLLEELTALKTEEDKITGNKVANFAYDDYAYEHNDANGVDTYNVNNHQNIPNGTASILKVNPTVLTKGWRAQASSITRMLIDHFLGRCSYNLNKVNDLFSSFLAKLMSFLGSPNGIATLDSNGFVPSAQLVGSDAMLNSTNYKKWLAKVFKDKLGIYWSSVTGDITSVTVNRSIFANGLFVCGTSDGCWWSEDGRKWEQGTGDCLGNNINNVEYVNGMWLCTGACWSEDGKHWTACTGTSIEIYSSSIPVTYNNGIYLAGCSTGLAWSEDGKQWTACTGFASGVVSCSTPAYGNGVWVCIGRPPILMQQGNYRGHYYSTNGKQWTMFISYTTSVIDERYGSYAYSEGKWVAYVGKDMYYSSNGTAWTQISLDTSNTKGSLCAVNGVFIITSGSTTYLATANNISSWSAKDFGAGSFVVDNVIGCANGLVSTEPGGIYYYSIKGIGYYLNGEVSYVNGVWASKNFYSFDKTNWAYNSRENKGKSFYCSRCYGKGVWLDIDNGQLEVSGIDELLASDYFNV